MPMAHQYPCGKIATMSLTANQSPSSIWAISFGMVPWVCFFERGAEANRGAGSKSTELSDDTNESTDEFYFVAAAP